MRLSRDDPLPGVVVDGERDGDDGGDKHDRVRCPAERVDGNDAIPGRHATGAEHDHRRQYHDRQRQTGHADRALVSRGLALPGGEQEEHHRSREQEEVGAQCQRELRGNGEIELHLSVLPGSW